MKLKPPLESSEQKKVIQWSKIKERKYPVLRWLHCSLNGVRLTVGQRSKAKSQGMVAGISDLFLPAKSKDGNYSGLFIEMKRISGSVTSLEQKEFLKFVNEQGYLGVICKGGDEAIARIVNYLED